MLTRIDVHLAQILSRRGKSTCTIAIMKKINIVKYYTTVVHAILSRAYVIGSNSEDVNCINTYIVWKLLLQYELIDFTGARHVHRTRIAKRIDINIKYTAK